MMMELTSITVEKFKKINKAKFDLSGLNILVGANGSGKSSALQAIHLASCMMRQAYEIRDNKTSTVSVNELDYLPSDHYAELGHNAVWGNTSTTPSSKIHFSFSGDDGTPLKAWCELRAARNAGISVKGALPGSTLTKFRGAGKFFTAYIPGISGIPNQEQKQSKRVVLKACSFGDSNVYLRNALKLLSTTDIEVIQNWLEPLIGKIELKISHREEKDLVIDARAIVQGKNLPLELLGAGYLQLVQIFCYVLLFKPKILLIDEPDIHLHPNVQEKLASVLYKISEDRGVKILLSTHSPFIIRGAPIKSNIYWMENGKITEKNRDAIELAMGWGAFGKKIIIVSEDQKPDLLKKIVSQWPEIEKFVTFHPSRGYKNLLKKEEAQELYNTLGQKYHILVHRDRDSLTDEEVNNLKASYEADGISLWLTEQSDVEAYFCDPELISELLGCDLAEAQGFIDGVLQSQSVSIKDQFMGQRGSHNQELHQATGGSPNSDDVWNQFQTRPLQGAKGKFVFKQLKNAIAQQKFTEEIVVSHDFNKTIALDLKEHIENILEADG